FSLIFSELVINLNFFCGMIWNKENKPTSLHSDLATTTAVVRSTEALGLKKLKEKKKRTC
ncbi:hypothetical protein, partial [Aquirufa nivalisilvae]